MRILLVFSFCTLFCFQVFGQKNIKFSKLKYDSVRMYDFEGGKGTDLYIINEKGGLAKNIKKQTVLKQAEIVALNQRLNNKKSFGWPTAACFDPHLGFVYYRKGKVIAHVTICLDCNRLHSSITIPEQQQGKVGKGEAAYYISDGLSSGFRNYLNKLLVRYKFSHQIK